MNKKVLKIIVLIICALVIIYESVMIVRDQLEYKTASSEYDQIREVAVTFNNEEDAAEVLDYPVMSINFSKLEEINPDVVAWLYVPCIDISYPVVKENEVDEYLYTTFEGDENKAGCLFEDVLSDPGFCGYHDIIFGHNMKDKSMFGKLKYLYQEDYKEAVEKNPYIYVYTRDYVFKYRIYAYEITTVGSNAYYIVENEEEYDKFINYCLTHNAYDKPDDISFDNRDSVLSLSTCSGRAGGNKRFVVHSLKVQAWEN